MTNNDILGIAFDAENGKVYFHVNGTYVTTDSVQHNPTAGTGGIDISGHSSWVDNTFWHWYCGDGSSSGYSGYSLNAGNGYFETTAITSEGTNASGLGKFQYDVPSGYYALCTKNLLIRIMAYTTINKPSDHFNTILYTGDGASSKSLTGVGLNQTGYGLKVRILTTTHYLILLEVLKNILKLIILMDKLLWCKWFIFF